jgi:NADPH-dependent 2,4-dienoyl-CoA reductase/sulfur reductase-like enzyme
MGEKFKYVIIGNGAAGVNALESIRKVDKESPATIISQESRLAISRTLLPYYVEGRIAREKVFIRDDVYYQRMKATSVHGRVVELDSDRFSLSLDDDKELSYEKLLIVTGATPTFPPIKGLDREKIFSLWTLDDAQNIISAAPEIKEVAIIGAGLIGVQSSHALANRDIRFNIIDVADRILPRVLDRQSAEMVKNMVTSDKVNIITGADITEIAPGGNGHAHSIMIDGMGTLDVDMIIVGTGAEPNTAFLTGSGIDMESGILVNDRMQTGITDVYAAGDAAQGFDIIAGEQVVLGIWTTAVEQGSVAGYNMAGRDMKYVGSLSTNVVDFFGVTVASIGHTGGAEGMDTESYVSGSGTSSRTVFSKDGVIQGATFVGSMKDAGVMQWLVRMKADISKWEGTLARQPLDIGRMMLGLKETDLSPHWPLPVE